MEKDVKINLKTDVPDGIERGDMKMKKTLLIMAAILVVAFLTSCAEVASFATGYSQGVNSGSRGYTVIGNYSSDSACKEACRRAGGSAYEYYPSTGNCFCK